MVTEYVPPDEALNEQRELADPPDATEMLDGPQDTVSPVDGLIDSDRLTVPENPPRLDAVIVEEPFEPSWKATIDGVGDTAKSATLTVI